MAITTTQMKYSNIPELNEFILNDIHRTGKQLGRGAFGVVEELKIGHSGTLYAGKQFHPGILNSYHDDEESVQRTARRFIAECKLMARIRHPRIVEFMGLCFFDDCSYPILVMEKLDFNLETILLETNQSIPFPVILHLLQDIAEGLIHLHSQRPPIIHRDLTARNVLVNQSSFRAKIGDLGSARLATDDYTAFTNSLSGCPGTIVYMAPEAFSYKPTYDQRLDMFSYGHLALFAVIQELPNNLEVSTYYSEKKIKARTEVERREKYIKKLIAKLTHEHVVTKMIIQCLDNVPDNRPTAKQVMEQIVSVSTVDGDEYSLLAVNLVGLINQVDKGESKAANFDTAGDHAQSMKRRIDNLKNGAPGILDILRVSGRVKLLRRHTWRTHVFQIKDGALNCFRQEMMDRLYDSLNLSSIVAVKACSPKKTWNKSMFYFEVHFSDFFYSPCIWQLRTYTQDERMCWMEAISAGSSGILPVIKSQHGTVIPATEDVRMPRQGGVEHHQIQKRIISVEDLYDYPYVEVPIDDPIQAQITSQSQSALLEHMNQTKKAAQACSKSPMASSTTVTAARIGRFVPGKQAALPPPIPHQGIGATVSQDKDSHEDLDAIDIYDMEPSDLPLQLYKGPQRNEPKELSAFAEHLSNMNPSEGLLWMLNQMQKLVEKFVGEYESSTVESPTMSNTCTRKLLSAQQINEVQMEASTLTPPVPPRAHSLFTVQKTYQEESSVSISCRSNMAYSGNKASPPITNNTLEEETSLYIHLPVAHDHPPTVIRSEPDSTVIENEIYSTPVSIMQTDSHAKMTETQSSQLAIAENALLIPRSTLSENLDEIGHGQYAKIFKGVYKRSEEEELPVAIKIAKESIPGSNFQQEMTMMLKLSHPNIVHFYGLVEQVADQPWIVLEFLHHGDLKTFLTKNKQPVNKLIKYMLDIATGMKYIAEKRLIHRDVAARNVMVSLDEICKVGDFGLLREIPKDADIYVNKTKTKFPVRWMSPETHLRREFSPATDVWSFGVVMWEMYNPTELPYQGLSNIEVAANVCMGTRLEIPKSYPPPVMRIMKACWQLEPSKRPSFYLITMLLTNVVFGTD